MCDGTHFTAEIRRRAVDAVMDGMTKTAVAATYGVDRNTVSRWVSKFCDGGGDALLRKAGSGRPRKLEDLTEEELLTFILGGRRRMDLKRTSGQSGEFVESSSTNLVSPYQRARFGADFAMPV